MKKFYIIIVLFIWVVNLSAFDELEYLRTTYYEAVEKENKVEELESYLLSKYDNKNIPPIITAYLGGVNALKSKHAFWITTKYSYFLDSMELFADAINKDSLNLEIRFMRFSVLHYVPGILGYSKEKKDDIKVIIEKLKEQNFSKVPQKIQIGMLEFLINSERLTAAQLNIVKDLLNG